MLRGGTPSDVTWTLPAGWRQREDISWRASSWGLRRMGTGGMWLEEAADEDRKAAGLAAADPAVRVMFVGQFGPHATAKQAGFLAGDVVTSFDGKAFARETDLLAYAVTRHQAGDTIPVEIVRKGRRMNLILPLRE